jgi:hypothetical protein
MRLFRHFAGGLACLALLAVLPLIEASTKAPERPAPATPDTKAPPSPLRLIPVEADAFAEVPSPRKLVETGLDLQIYKQLKNFPAARELLDNTKLRRGKQLLAYFEKELGAKWPDLLDRLAGGGIAAGAKFGDKAPLLLAIQGTDEALLKKFVTVGLKVIEDELARLESTEKPVKSTYRGIETIRLGKELFIARAGSALLVSNKDEVLKRGLNLHLGVEKKSLANFPLVAEADKLLPPGPLARLWINLKVAHDSEQGKAIYKSPRDDANLTTLFGGILDVIGRSPFVTAGVYPEKDGFLTTVRLPRGRRSMGNDRLLHLPPAGLPGTRPLLGPKGVMYSQSFYLDLAAFWKEREKLFPKKVADAIGNADKGSGKFLGGAKISALLGSTAPYHRLVAVNQPNRGYKRKPKQVIPAFAFISELREPEKFGRSMDTVLRAGAFLATTQFKMTLLEEKHKGVDVVAYRFDEEAKLKQDVNDIRFNFSPCYARVGNQFIFCSTIELCRELIELLQKEQKSPAAAHPATERIKVYADGVAKLLEDSEDQAITQVILDQAVPPGEAREQVRAFFAFVRKLGSLNIDATFLDNELRYEFRTGK